MNTLTHRTLLLILPLATGLGAALLQGITVRHLDPWLISAAAVSGALAAFVNFVRGQEAPPQTVDAGVALAAVAARASTPISPSTPPVP